MRRHPSLVRFRPGMLFALLILGVATAACIRMGTQERRNIVLNDGSLEKRLQAAQGYVTEEKLGSLRVRAQSEFSELTDVDLAGLDLGWQRLILKQEDAVLVYITFMPKSSSENAGAVADFLAEQVREDLRPQFMEQETAPLEPLAVDEGGGESVPTKQEL